jgi:predicted alpha/beta hydrolase
MTNASPPDRSAVTASTSSRPNPSGLESVAITTGDGFVIRGSCWRHPATGPTRPVVVINPATSVRSRYYHRFASHLFEQGFDVIAYDYRGIGDSRPPSLRGFDASWLDWGSLDFDAVLRYAAKEFPSQPIYVVAHSVGGFLVGLARSSIAIQRIFTVGAQYAYWRDYAAPSRLRMLLKWHLLMPLLTVPLGYFPGKRLGWLEDTPRGVVRDWVFSRERFEDTWRGRAAARYPDKDALVRGFAAVTAPTLALSVTDDEFGTVPAIERLLSYFTNSPRAHLRVAPQDVGEAEIGHFNFFHERFAPTLWPIGVEWLKAGRLRADGRGQLLRLDGGLRVQPRGG